MTAAIEMTTDKWVGRQDLGVTTVNPSLADIEDAICQLDGTSKTTVSLINPDGGGLIIAGQWNGMCIVNATLNSVDFYSLVDLAKGLEKRLLFVGGQDGDYEAQKCVPLDWSIIAVRKFYECGILDESLPWKSDY